MKSRPLMSEQLRTLPKVSLSQGSMPLLVNRVRPVSAE